MIDAKHRIATLTISGIVSLMLVVGGLCYCNSQDMPVSGAPAVASHHGEMPGAEDDHCCMQMSGVQLATAPAIALSVSKSFFPVAFESQPNVELLAREGAATRIKPAASPGFSPPDRLRPWPNAPPA